MDAIYSVETLSPEFTRDADAVMERYYFGSSAREDIPPYDFDWGIYQIAEESGCLLICTARIDTRLVGWTLHLLFTHPHHRGMQVADGDSIAIDMEYRGNGIGGHLYDFAERELRGLGVEKVLHRYRLCYGDQTPLYAKKGFKLIEHVYMKEL